MRFSPGDENYSFLVGIGDQTPTLGRDPELAPGQEVLAEVRWMRLCEIPECDPRVSLAAGLIGVGGFLSEMQEWGREVSYPGDPQAAP